MNEKLQYAEMLEIPISTCNIMHKPIKKKKKKAPKIANQEAIKQELIDKVNSSSDLDEHPIIEEQITSEIKSLKKQKRSIKLNVIGVQLIIIGILVATIFLTTALVPNSGISVFMNNVFGTQTMQDASADLREYNEFSANLPVSGTNGITTENGIMTLSLSGSV